MAHFLYGYIQMRFTTLCGGLCQTQLYGAVHNLFNVRSRIHWGPQNKMSYARPQHRDLHALLLTNSVWVLQRSTLILTLVRRDLRLIALI